jgi:Tol biopolymer transport system component
LCFRFQSVHRDLKPANIKITPDGAVKLLDFGLAKAFTNPNEPSANAENSPTLTIGATEVGVILGTAAYMSPEQAKGKSVDKRADIWAFGVVLYELLTGDRLFKGEDVADILAQVLTKEPTWDRAPAKARRLLRLCLEKDPRQRLRDIGDARELLEDAQPTVVSNSRVVAALAVLASVLLVALAILAFIYFREAPPKRAVLRYTIAPPENTTNLHSFAISPDGRFLAIAADVSGKRQLWLRPLGSLQAEPIPGTEDATYPFWSPDSRYIGFFGQGKLQKRGANGGPTQSLCDAPNGLGGSWNRDDTITFVANGSVRAAVQRISANGGSPTDVANAKGYARFPVFLSDGRNFLYLLNQPGLGSQDQRGVYIASLDGKENRRVLPDASSVVFSTGRLLFIRENTLMAQLFDTASRQAIHEAFPVATNIVPRYYGAFYAPVTASETGVLVYESGGHTTANQMAWYDRRGNLLETVSTPGPVLSPAISPDAKSALFSRGSEVPTDLWLRDLTRGLEQRFTTVPAVNYTPFWSSTGDRIVYSSSRSGGVFNLYQKAASGTGQDELLLATGNNKSPTQWSRDGRYIVYIEADQKTKHDIWVLPMDGGTARQQVPFLKSEFDELFGQLSPDSHWMAFTSDASGQREVYVRPFPTAERQWRISFAGGEQPRWRADGKELFFVGADGKMMAVAVKATAGTMPSFEPGVPQPMFEAHLAQSPGNLFFQYDVTEDGKRFLLSTAGVGHASPTLLTVLVNWDAELKK